MKKISKSQLIKFIIYSLVFVIMIIWIGNYWLLLPGLAIIFDIYISKIVPWTFWKKTKDGKKPSKVVEWIDAIVFALVAVYIINLFFFQNYKIPTSSLEKSMLVGDHLFVSKMSYGPRMPFTPIAFPLVQNSFPVLNTKSYTDWPSWDYKRLKGFKNVERNDIVVFNFPTGDTVPFFHTNPDYYITIRELGLNQISQNSSLIKDKTFENEYEFRQFANSIGRKIVEQHEQDFGKIYYRPVDRRDNYVKRCVALPGDIFEIRNNQIYINGEISKDAPGVQYNYHIITDGTLLNQNFFDRLEISNDDKIQGGIGPHYILPLTEEKVEQVKKFNFIISVKKDEHQTTNRESVFPFSEKYPWTRDNYGPLVMPKKGETIDINIDNILLYERIITAYELNTLEVKGDKIFINGVESNKYTFQMDYYFMMGDNRHKSADSRYWGFVPEDHIVGRPMLVWLSLNKDKKFPANIRWNRFFKVVTSE